MQKEYSITTKDIQLAAKFISQGRIIAFPTGTSYGLAVNALDGHSLQRLRNLKGRPGEKPFTIFLSNKIWSKHLNLTDSENKILTGMNKKPLTLLVKPKSSLQHVAKNNLVGLRVIDHPDMEKLAAETMLPLTATSANKTDALPCSSPRCITKTFPGLLPDSDLNETNPKGASDTTYDLSLAGIIDAGQLPPNKPTTIAQILNGNIKIIRPGALSPEEIKTAL